MPSRTSLSIGLTIRFCILITLLLIPCALSLSSNAQPTVRYELRFPNAVHHEVEVQATFSGVRTPVLEVVMSRSSPGRYALHDFAKNVYNFSATDGEGRALEVIHANPHGWNIVPRKSVVVVKYTVFGDRADGTYNGIDETHAHVNMPATLAWAHGFETVPLIVTFHVPKGSNWKIATQLPPRADGTWIAPNLQSAMDSPVEISDHAILEWKVEDTIFRLALHHRGTDAEASAYGKMCEMVVLEEEGIFGAFPKYDGGTYTFLVDYLPYVVGDGMEHRNSSVITNTRNLHDAAFRLIDGVSHEFFHSWNVKRIRPKTLEPFTFEQVNMSGELWFVEGFTNYYSLLVRKRAGLISLDQFVKSMGSAVNAVLTLPGRTKFNIVDMSRMAPFVDGAPSIDPTNQDNVFISYYTYGQALAFGLDLAIRNRFPSKALDDWMRTMWSEHPDVYAPYDLKDLERTLGKAVGDRDFAAEVFRRYIYAMEAMDYERLVGGAGLALKRVRDGDAWIGSTGDLKFSDNSAEITRYARQGSPLYDAGLEKGDQILEWDGESLKSADEVDRWVAKHKPGYTATLKTTRRNGQCETQLTLQENPNEELVTFESLARSISPEVAAFRERWLGSKAIHPMPILNSTLNH